MKKKIRMILFSAMLFCAGCGKNSDNPVDSFNEPSPSPEVLENIPAAAGSQAPYWAQGVRQDGKLYQGLNLDGVGDADDEAYVSMYRFGDDSRRIIALIVHLGTGETLTEIYPLFEYQDYGFMTGRIFSEDRDAIILGTQNLASNYNATNLWVLEVHPAKSGDEYSAAGMWVLLDTAAQPDGMSLDVLKGNGLSWGLVDGNGFPTITWFPEVVDMEGSPLQGLKVTIYDPHMAEGISKEWENIIYWKEGLWSDGNRTYKGKWEFVGDWMPVSE